MNECGQAATAAGEDTPMMARLFMAAAAPRSADIHLFESDDNFHLFVANGSRLFDISPDLFSRMGAAISAGQVDELLARVGADGPPLIDDTPLQPPPIHALSL